MSMCMCIYLVAFGEDGRKQSRSTQYFKLRVPRTLTHNISPDHTDESPHGTMVFSPQKCEKQGQGGWRALMQGCRGELKLETSSLPTSRSREQLVQRCDKCELGTHLSLWKQKGQPHSLPSESAQFNWVPMPVFVWCSCP